MRIDANGLRVILEAIFAVLNALLYSQPPKESDDGEPGEAGK